MEVVYSRCPAVDGWDDFQSITWITFAISALNSIGTSPVSLLTSPFIFVAKSLILSFIGFYFIRFYCDFYTFTWMTRFQSNYDGFIIKPLVTHCNGLLAGVHPTTHCTAHLHLSAQAPVVWNGLNFIIQKDTRQIVFKFGAPTISGSALR